LSHCRWNILPLVQDRHLDNASGFSSLIIQLLYNRGFTDLSQYETFVTPDERLIGDPFLLPDIHQAIARIYRALLCGENIAVYGDFDVDGITGTALLVKGLSLLGANPIPYIPHRLTEGYGLNIKALTNLHEQGVSLVITVDCGITALAEIKKAKRMGLDVIITDHHTPLPTIPPAVAAVNPKLPNSAYPFQDLAGVGVALKLLQALFQSVGKERLLDELMDLVALGTVADMTPLLGENRYLVKQGLRYMNNTPRLGIREMMVQAGLDLGNIDAESISWVIAPRLNAAGRLAHAMSSYNLIMTDSTEEAKELSTWLEQKNTERRRLTEKALALAREQVLTQGILPLLIASDSSFPSGIAGLVASRLSEEFYRPSVVINIGDVMSGGSCRSIPEFNIIAALNKCSRLMSRFGGHAQAAGFSLLTRNLPHLTQHLSQIATEQLSGLDLRPSLDIDAEVGLVELNGENLTIIQNLAPFGCANPLPVFLSRRVNVVDCRTMGGNGNHLRLRLQQHNAIWEGLGFGMGLCLGEISPFLDIVYNLKVDRWRGEERLQLNILDFAPSSQ